MARSPWCVVVGLGALLLMTLGCAPRKGSSSSTTTSPPPTLTQVAADESIVNEMPAWAGQDENEPFDVQAFLAPRLGPANDAAKRLYGAMVPISNDVWANADPDIEKQAKELANIDSLAADRSPSLRIDNLLKQTSPALREVDAALLQSRCVFNAAMYPDSLLPHCVTIRLTGCLTLLQIKQGSVRGDFAQVEHGVERSLRLARELQPRSAFVGQLVSMALEGQTLPSIERIVLADPALTVEQIDRLLALLDAHQKQSLNRVEEGLQMEYVLSRNGLHAVQTGRLTLQEFLEVTSADVLDPEPQAFLTMRPPICNFPAEIRTCNDLYTMALEAARQPASQGDRTAAYAQRLLDYRARIDEFKKVVAATPKAERPLLFDQAPACLFYFFSPVLDPFLEVDSRTTARLSATQMLLALRRYELVHQRLPPDLSAAAAETIVKQVPLDPYDGQPLRYVVVAGKPIVYSVGKDRLDQHGEVDAREGQQAGDYLYVLPRSIRSAAGSAN